MKIDEFVEEVTKLENFYQKEVTDDQRKVWFDALKTLPVERFRYIISQIYRTQKFLPKLADILEANANLGYGQEKEDKKNDCPLCEGTGYILYWKEKEGQKYQYGSICKCRQKAKYEGWKIADEKNRSNYFIPYAEEVGVHTERKTTEKKMYKEMVEKIVNKW